MKITQEGFAVIERDTHISKWVEESGRLDHDQNMLPLILKEIPFNSVIFDIGAFIGDHTIAYTRKGHVVAFEPNPEAYDCLVYNMKNKGVSCHNIAFSDKVEGYSVEVPNDNIGMATLTDGDKKKTTTIDQYVIDYGVVPDFIKIDAEGMEYKILFGALETLKKYSPKLVLEINEQALINHGTSKEELFEFLDKLGYKYRDIYGKALHLLHTQFDILCIR
jgi:FkbM family methyltransferase